MHSSAIQKMIDMTSGGVDVETMDKKTYTVHDLTLFSQHPESVMWQTLEDGGLEMFQMFVLSCLTHRTLDAIVTFHERGVWPYKPCIEGVYDPFVFLGLPGFPTAYDSEDEDVFVSSDGE